MMRVPEKKFKFPSENPAARMAFFVRRGGHWESERIMSKHFS